MDYIDKNRQNMQRILNYYGIPEHMHEAIIQYVIKGDHPGGFLSSVVENDLFKTVGKADSNNLVSLPSFVKYFYNAAPSNCRGSREIVEEWCGGGGLAGVYKEDNHNEMAVSRAIAEWVDRHLERLSN